MDVSKNQWRSTGGITIFILNSFADRTYCYTHSLIMLMVNAGLYPGEKMKPREGREICFSSIEVESLDEKNCRRVISQQTKMEIRQSQLLF